MRRQQDAEKADKAFMPVGQAILEQLYHAES